MLRSGEWGRVNGYVAGGESKKEKESCADQLYLQQMHTKTSDEIVNLMTRIFIYLISSFDEYAHEM